MGDMFLIFLLLLPAVGAIICALLPNARSARGLALFITVVCAALAVCLVLNFQFSGPAPTRDVFQFQVGFGKISAGRFEVDFHFGIDAISLWLIVLTAFLMPLAI